MYVITNSWYVVHTTDNAVAKAVGHKFASYDGTAITGNAKGYGGANKVKYADRLKADSWLNQDKTKPLNTTYWEIKDGSTPMLKCFQ